MMEFNKSTFSQTLLSILLLASSVVVEAQDTPVVAVTPKIEKAHVEKSGIYYTIVDKTLDYEIAVTGGTYKISKADWVLKRDNTDVASSNDTTTLITFNADKDGLYKLTGEVTLSWQVNEKDTSTVVKVTNVPDVRLLPIPNLEIAGSTNIVSYHDREFEMKFSTTVKDGSWDVNMTPTLSAVKIEGSGLSFKSKLNNTTNSPIEFEVNANGRYLYEGKELYSVKKTFNVTVYSQIGIMNPDEEEWNTAKKSSRTFSVSVKGGYPDGWIYEWKKNGSAYSASGNSIEINVTPGKSVDNDTYEVTAINKYDNMEFGRIAKTFKVNIFPETSIAYASASEFHISNDSVIILKVETDGGYEDGWEYRWEEDGVTLPCTDKVYEKEIKPGDETKTYTYKVVATNKYHGNVLDELNKNFNVTVYAKPRVEKPSFRETVVGGIELECYVRCYGGNPEGWKFTWYRDGDEISGANESKYNFVENNSGSGFVEHKYSVRVENYFDNQKWFDETFDFTVKVYPNVVISYQIIPGDLYLYQQSVIMGASFSGGCTDGSWSYEWYKDNTASPVISYEKVYEHNSYNVTSNIVKDTYILSVVHKYDGETLLEKNIIYTVYNYPLARINRTTSDKVVISGGNKVEFGIKAECANPDGWSFQWMWNGNTLSAEKKPSLSMIEPNPSETETLNHTYSVIVTNRYGAKIWVQDTLEFNSVVRPTIIPPTQIQYDYNMRENDDVNLKATAGRGGDPDGWSYQWYNSYNTHKEYEITGQNSHELSNYPKVGVSTVYYMESKPVQYALYCKNVDKPTGTVLYEGTIKYEVVVHRRPLEPFELVKKGGSANKSNIYIADMYQGGNGLNDTRLSDYEYKFCFGYGDNNEINREDATKRYYQYTKQQANEGPWVYTYWEYPDGYVCKSDIVYYGSSRATTSIDGVYENSVIKINSNGFTATLSSEMPAVVRVISINGEVVKEMLYECSSDFDERFEFQGLKSGFYLVEVCIGENREVSKVFVNE